MRTLIFFRRKAIPKTKLFPTIDYSNAFKSIVPVVSKRSEKFRQLIFLFFLSFSFVSLNAQDTLICQNGGFENDFQYYFKGERTTFSSGSNDCNPKLNGNPVVWVNSALPAFRRFAIVTSGVDPLVGINKTKFGNKSLLVNDRYGHTSNPNPVCSGSRDINKIIKRFRVTEETRDFTVWYAVALENPAGHVNSQPYLNIKCDLAPLSELCFDADFIECDSIYDDVACPPEKMDVLNWSCHRIKIPQSEVGKIATLEISMADCGLGCHNGYAYIDGICEQCTGSALGAGTLNTINYSSCDGLTARVCGTYTLPTICNKNYQLQSVTVPGYTIQNVTIDHVNRTFCFDFPLSNFTTTKCLEIYANLLFGAGASTLPVVSTNNISICKDNYIAYAVNFGISGCNPNGTNNNISDDYYSVNVSILNTNGAPWTIERQLTNPYPGESGYSLVKTGTGDKYAVLGPYFIQEGASTITVTVGNCVYTYDVIPPQYCSGCVTFRRAVISNVACSLGNTWSYKITTPPPPLPNTCTTYTVGTTTCTYGTPCTINVGAIGQTCVSYNLVDGCNALCSSKITVCPPKPCVTPTECDLEVKVKQIFCGNDAGTSFGFSFEATTNTTNNICYKVIKAATGNTAVPNTSAPSLATAAGLTEDVYLVVYLCPPGTGCGCTPTCYKVIYIPKPLDCSSREYMEGRSKEIDKKDLLRVMPNPFNSNIFELISTMEKTNFEIYDGAGRMMHKGSFEGQNHALNLDLTAGMYYIRYVDSKGNRKYIKAIKI